MRSLHNAWYLPNVSHVAVSLLDFIGASPLYLTSSLACHPIAHSLLVGGRWRSLFGQTTSPALLTARRALPPLCDGFVRALSRSGSILQPCHPLSVVFLQLGESCRVLLFPFATLGACLLYASIQLASAQREVLENGGGDLPIVGENACSDEEGCHGLSGDEDGSASGDSKLF